MKKIIIVILSVLFTNLAMSQVLRVAISDFENLSGNPKYDGLGKALSSMLISDIELNVSGKKMQLVERSQLNKILKEQNLQTSKSFDKATTVKVGKLLGINFILVGDIFILNDDIIINARLTSVENGDIKFSNKQEGKLSQWLSVKTKIAKDLSSNLKVPFIEPTIEDKEINLGVLNTFINAINASDVGDLNKSELLINTIKEISSDFKYVDDLKIEIDKLKEIVKEQGKKIEEGIKINAQQDVEIKEGIKINAQQDDKIKVVEKSGDRVIGANSIDEYELNLNSQLTSNKERELLIIEIINKNLKDVNKIINNYGVLASFHKEYKESDSTGFYISLKKSIEIVNNLKNNYKIINNKKLYSEYLLNKLNTLLTFSILYYPKNDGAKFNMSDDDYLKIRNIEIELINDIYENEKEKEYIKYLFLNKFIQSYFMIENKLLINDINESTKNILKNLNYKFTDELLYVQVNNPNKKKFYELIDDSRKIVFYLSRDLNEFKNFNNNSGLLEIKFEAFRYLENSISNKRDLDEITASFYLPSITNTNELYDKETPHYGYSIHIEKPKLINPTLEIYKKIKTIDSISGRRYLRIKEILEKLGKSEDACYISNNKINLLKTSDSLAISENLYVNSGIWTAGNKIELLYNNGANNKTAIILNDSIKNSINMFEIIKLGDAKIINTDFTITYKIHTNNYFNQIRENDVENSLDMYDEICENKKEMDSITSLREKENEKYRLYEEKKQLEFNNTKEYLIKKLKENKLIVDIIKIQNVNNLVNNGHPMYRKIFADSMFRVGFETIIDEGNYNKTSLSNNKFNPAESIIINLFNFYNYERKGDKIFKNASIINLAHGLLLCSIKYKIDLYNDAFEYYNKVAKEFQFDESFNNVNREQMIMLDWEEFLAKKIITKKEIDDFNMKYKILNKF
jgi:TolB-like protein